MNHIGVWIRLLFAKVPASNALTFGVATHAQCISGPALCQGLPVSCCSNWQMHRVDAFTAAADGALC